MVGGSRLGAQDKACPEPGVGSAVQQTGELRRLPVDRLSDLLALEPGVTSLDHGDLTIRGSGPGAVANYVDGVPVMPGHRRGSALLGGSYFGDQGTGLGVGTNGFDHLALYRGLAPAEFGNGRGGVLAIATAGSCSPRGPLAGSLASDVLFGKKNGIGFNRLTLDGQGRLGKVSLGGAAVVEGLESARLGLEQNESPVFVADGIDTTVSNGGTPEAVLGFRRSDGIRIPSSANGSYTLNGRVGYEVLPGQQVTLSAHASQRQNRQFDYDNLYNPRQTRADRSWSRMVTGSWAGPLRTSEALALRGEAHLSWQTDRIIEGPLSSSGEQDTRNPFGGFMVSPVDFRFDFDNFAVDDDLVRNFRTNSGRLSPYDLNNPNQFGLIDLFRNNAYGLSGFSESGGPIGLLTLSKENRLVGKGVLDAGRRNLRLRLGAEFTRYSVDFYESPLTSQAGSNAYVESPRAAAFFADAGYSRAPVEVNVGVRYDHFSSRASRPDFPRISSAPGFDPANPTAGFTKDQGHGRVSPRIRATVAATPRLSVTGGIGALAQQPDFALVYAGINTDLSVTGPTSLYGTDLDYEHAAVYDLGARYQLQERLSLEGSVSHREDKDLVQAEFVSEFDPVRGSQTSILRALNSGSTKATSFDLRVRRSLGGRGQAWLSYSYTDATRELPRQALGATPTSVPTQDNRPHTVTGAVLFQSASDSRLAGGVLRNTGVFAALRFASGTAYTGCSPADPANVSVLSGETCALFFGDPNGDRLPWVKLVDLRVTRGFDLGRVRLTAFADARNLLNTRVVTRVFAATGKTSSSAERLQLQNANLNEFANEAQANGVQQVNGTIDLSFGGVNDPRAACASWVRGGSPAVPNCVYLIGAEERWGNGDHLFTVAEQARAADAFYLAGRGLQNFTGPGRRVRIGVEVGF
jgi:TonB-dependent receptor-like protein